MQQLCIDFLILTKLAHSSSQVTVDGGIMYVSSCLVGVRRILVATVDSIVDISSYNIASDEILMLVCKDYQHTQELLVYNKLKTLELMLRNMLIVHRLGMMYSLKVDAEYVVMWCAYTGNEVLDRRAVINACTNKDTAYFSKHTSIDSTPPEHILYHHLNEPLDTLGVEYIFSLYRTSRELCVRANTLIYIIKAKNLVNVVRIS